jgi:hypothetical protein
MGVGIVAVLVASLRQLPPYYRAAVLESRGDSFAEHGQQKRAVESYTQALELAPGSESARVGLAIVYFKSPAEEDHKKALKVLGGLTIEKSDWEKLTAVMPKDYLRFFHDVKK